MDTSVHFEKIAEEITILLEAADHDIVAAIAWFTDQSLFNILRRKASSGVAVKLLYLDDKIKNLVIEKEIRAGKYKLEVGNALSVKLIKALTYTFKTVHLVKKPSYAGPEKIDAMMLVTLQDVDMNLDVKIGFVSVETESYSRFAIRAEIKDMESKDTVWVGTTQAQTTGKHEEMAKMTYQEAGRGFAVGIDMAIDKVVGNLVRQMEKSQSLSSHLKIWEQKT